MLITIIILIVSAVFFAIGKTRADIVALCSLTALLLAGILTPEEALAGFSSSVVIMMVGLFVVGGAIFQTGLAKMLGGKIIRLAGNNETVLFIAVMLVTAAIGAFVSNTGTVALMMPIVVSMATKAQVNARRMLMPLAFASSMGGMLTLIGTPPNLVISDVLTDAGYEPLGFFSFTPVGLICIAVGLAVLMPLSRMMLRKRGESDKDGKQKGKSLRQLVDEYHLADNMSRFTIGANSVALGKTLAELDIRNTYGLTVLEIRHESRVQRGLIRKVEQKPVSAGTILDEGDIIYVTGNNKNAKKMADTLGLSLGDGSSKGERLAFYDIGLAEIILLPGTTMVNRSIREAGFREKYGVNIMGIRRSGEYIMDGLPDVKMKSGDILLVQGTWEAIGKLNNNDERWVVLGQPLEEAARVTIDYKAPLAAGIMILMVVAMVTDIIPIEPVTAVIAAGLLMVLCGCFRNVEAAYKTINWESVVLIAAMMPMSVALEKTGASSAISHSLVSTLGEFGPMALLAGIYLTTSAMTMVISNTATAILMAPIALSSATEMGVSPLAMLFAVSVAASMCFASPFSTPPNALVMQAGEYRFSDYIKVGLPLQVIMGLVMVLVLPLLFPF